MTPLATLIVEANPEQTILSTWEGRLAAVAVGRLGGVPLSAGRGRDVPVVVIETERFLYLDQRLEILERTRKYFRVALALTIPLIAVLLIPMTGEHRALCLLPLMLGWMPLGPALGSWQLNRGVGGLANVIVLDKNLAASDTNGNDVRVLSGETRRQHLFCRSFADQLAKAGRLPQAFDATLAAPLYRAPLFRWLRRVTPATVTSTYRISRAGAAPRE